MPVGKSRQLTDFEKNLKEEIYKRDNHIDNSVKYAIDTGQDYGVSKDTPQWRRDAINKYRDSHKVEIYDDNGNIVGTVGYEAHKAINKNKVFDYKGKNDEERKVFSYLRQRQNREARKKEQREYVKNHMSNPELEKLKFDYNPKTSMSRDEYNAERQRRKDNKDAASNTGKVEFVNFRDTKTARERLNSQSLPEFVDFRDVKSATEKLKKQNTEQLPEFGSYKYYENQADEKAKELEEIDKYINDNYSLDDINIWQNAKEGVRDAGENAVKYNSDEKLKGIDNLMSRKADILDDYVGAVACLEAYEGRALKFKEDGSVDTDNVRFVSGNQKKRYEVMEKYGGSPAPEYMKTPRQPNEELNGELAAAKGEEEKQTVLKKIDRYQKDMLDPTLNKITETVDKSKKNVAVLNDNIDAANYYDKNKDNKYGDGVFGRIAGNYRIGDIGEERAMSAFNSYAYSDSDLTATQIYDELSRRIQERNKDTFTNTKAWQQNLATIAQYVPQGRNQAIARLKGAAVGSVIPLVGSKTGGDAAAAMYMFKQTAGNMYADLILEEGLSPEEAKKLSANNALWSGVVEYGLESALGGVLKGIGKGVKKIAPTEKVIKVLEKTGLSEEAAKKALSAAKTAGNYAVGIFGEGAEEWIQQGGEIVTKRYAAKGESASALKIAAETFDFSKYTDEDFDEMNEAFKGGAVIGFASTVGSRAAVNLAQSGMDKLAAHSDNKAVGKAALTVSQPDVLINRAIDAGLESSDEKTVGRIQKLADKYKSGNASAAEVGEIIKTGLRTGYEQEQNLKVTEDTQTNDDVALPTQDSARQSVLAVANSGNSESSVISPSVTAAANVSERQMHDVKENLSEGGAAQSVEQVQNAVKKVTNTMINEFKNSNIKNIPNYQAAYDENLRLSTTKGATIDKNFIKTYANQYAEGLKRNNSKAYKELASVSDDVGSMLTDYLISNRIPQGIGDISALAQAGGELRSIVGKAAQTTLAMNGKIYNDTDRVSAISNEISNGNFAVVDGANDGNIALAKVGEYYEAYGADAVALAKAFGVSTHYIQKNGRKTLVAAVPSKYIGEYAAKSGYSGTQYSAGGNEYIYLTKDVERGNLSADAVRSDITAESDSDFIAEIENNGMIELDERPSESKIETIAAQVERDNTIPVYLDGVDKLGEVLLVYANEEDVTRNMVKTDINSYYDGVMPERGIPLSENTDRHYDEDTIEISERPSEYDADSYALVVELDRTIPILLNGVDELGEVELNYSNEENVTRDMVKSDIDAYYSGTMPEHGVSLSNNYDPDIKFSVDGEGYSKQLVTDFETAAKDIMTISDYSARVNAEARTAVRILENTPNVILDNIEGSADLPIVINFTKMYLAARKSGVIKGNYHNLGSDILMKLPQMISDPDMILQLGNGRLNLLSETKTENGNNAVVSIELNSTKDIEGKNKNYNVVVTLFSANDNYVRNLINKDGTEIKYTKEDLSQVNPRLYNRPATFNDKSSINNISQNDDIVNSNIRENSENDTENVKFSQDNSLDGGGIIRYNDDIDIPYRESKQLREYIMSENNRNGSELKSFDKKEIGDNFYVWKNNSKTDYDVVMQIEIDGNEDVIDLIRKGLDNGKTYGIDNGTKRLDEIVAGIRDRRRGNNSDNARNTAELSNGNDDRLYSRQSSDDDGIKFAREGGRNQQNTEVGNYGRDDILNGNDRRTLGESEGERGSGVPEITGNAEGNAGEEQSSASSRRIYARDVKEAGGVERRNDRGVEADFVKSEYYNDEMRRIAAENDERGVVTHFILGNGRAIEYGTNFRGAVRGNEVYIQADHGKYSPTQINRHEIIHRNYSSDTVQTLKNRIKSRLTNEQIRDIAESLYRDYAQKRRSFDEIFEEFVCDVMADMNDYAEMFETETREYWAAEKKDRKGYSPSTYTESIDAGGEVNEYKNTETLGKNEAYRSNDSVWTQSDDTGEVYRRLEGNRTSSSVRLEKRSGFVDWSRNIQPNSTDYTRAKKRAYGILREISKKRIADVDTEGRTLSHGIKEYFSDTVFKNEQGELIPLFHSTDNEFNTFEHGDFGFHLGSAEQAVSIGAKYIKEVYVNIKNPFYAMDMGKWPALVVADEARRQGVIFQSEYDAISKMDDFYGWEYDSRANASLRNLLKARGYDGIIYNNRFEGDGISAIAFDSNQIKYVSNQNPTQSSDIRFSTDENTDVNVSDDEDMSYLSEPVRNIRNDINEVINRADLKKGGKVYDRAAAVRVRDSIIANLDVGVDRGEYLHLSEKDKNAMLVLVNRTLNASAPKRINSEAKILARFIAQKAKVYTAADYDYSGVKSFILDYTRHAVSITPDVKQALITVFGEDSAKGYSALFGKSERTGSAQTIDAIYDEMSDVRPDLFPTDVLGEGEKMRRIAEIYAWAKDGEAETNGSARLIDVMSTEDKQKFANGVYEQLISALDSDYRPSKTRSAMNEIRNEYETEIAKIKGEMKKRAEDRAKRADIRRSPEQWQTERMKNAPEPKKRGKIAQAINDSERVQSAKQRLGIGNGISNIGDIVDFISNKFGVVISTGKVSGKTTGIYKEQSGNMRVRNSNDIPTVAFELGKHLNKTYKFTEMDSIGTLMKQIYYTNSDIFNDFNAGSLGISKLISGADEQALKAKNAAVSEFMREYLLNKDVAKEKYPQFYADFVMRMSDEKVGKKTDVKNLDAAADMINKYMSSPTSERIDAMTVTNKQAKIAQTPTITESARKFYLDWVDSFNPIKNVMSYVKKVSGGDIIGKKDAYTIAMNSLNATTIANYINTKGMTDLDGNINLGKSFIECVGDVKKKDLNTFDRYLIIKHALEWIEPLDENTPKKRVFADETLENPTELRRELAAIEKQHPEMKQAAENLYEFQRNVIENFVIPAGGISQAEYQKLIAKYPSYVPFFRATNKRGKLNQFIKGTLANQSSPIKTANGGGELLISPLESIIRNTEKMVKFGTRQRTMQILAEYADSVDGMGKFMEKVSPDMMMTRDGKKSFEMIKDVLADKVNAEDYLDLTGAIADILGDTDGGFSPIADEKNMIVTVMNDGKKSYYQIHDRLLYEAIADMTPQEANMAVRISGAIMNPMKILITQNNPIFALTNAIRDIQTAYKNSNINNPIMFAAKYANAAYGMLKKSDDYKRYQAMGGGHSSELSANMESIKESIRALNNKDKVAAIRILGTIVRHPIQSIATVNDFVESTPRFMEFKNKLKQTGDTQSAIYAADDLTTNFKRVGKKGRSVNKVIMYNNAGVQGLDKMRRSFTDVPKNERNARIAKYAISALMTTALMEFWNRRDEESEDAWENLSAYKKNNFYNFSIGDGNFISIPKARELSALSSFFERCADKYFYDNDDAFYDFGGYLWQQFTPPILPEPGNPVDMAHSLFGSTVLSSLTDIGFNKDFKGSPIESEYDKTLYPFQRYNENTSKIAVWLGQTEIARKLNISPKQLDHILSSNLGIIGQINKALFPINESRRDLSFGLRNKFIADSNYSTDVLNKMYDNTEVSGREFAYSPSADNAIKYENDAILSSFVTRMNTAVRSLPDDQQRMGRAYLLKCLKNWDSGLGGNQKDISEKLKDSEVSKDTILRELPTNKLKWTVNKQDFEYELKPNEYAEYTKDLLSEIARARSEATGDGDDYQAAVKDAISNAKSAALERAKEKYAPPEVKAEQSKKKSKKKTSKKKKK